MAEFIVLTLMLSLDRWFRALVVGHPNYAFGLHASLEENPYCSAKDASCDLSPKEVFKFIFC